MATLSDDSRKVDLKIQANDLIQDLITVMIQEKCLRRKHFHVLLQSSITSINLSGALPAANHDSILNILINRCPRLHIIFGFCRDCPRTLASCRDCCPRKMASYRDCPSDSSSCREPRQEAESHGQSLQEAIYHLQKSRQEAKDRGQFRRKPNMMYSLCRKRKLAESIIPFETVSLDHFREDQTRVGVWEHDKKLISLNLSRLNGLSPRVISDLLKAFPGMKVLNLEKTKCNDQVLSIMGNCCTNLVDLNINCTPVTNSGALSLCGGFSSDRPGCTSLVKLNIMYTMIDEIGASHILESIPGLKYLGFQDICGAIQHGRDVEMNRLKDPRVYQVRNVTSFTMSCEETFITCPYATEVCLLNGLSDSNIHLLDSLPHVQILKLSNFNESILTFDEGLLPYLRQNGKKLIELDLAEIGSVDVLEIARTCPNLQRFSLTQTRSVAVFHVPYVSAAEKRTFFSNITHLKVVLLVMEENFPALALDCTLSNAKKLTTIQLLNVKTLTTDLLISALSHNTMSCLKELRLENCSGITGEGIMSLLEAENDLTIVSLIKCDHVMLRDHERFLKFARKNNLDISLEWT